MTTIERFRRRQPAVTPARKTRNRMILGHRSDNKHNPVPESEIRRHELLALGQPLKEKIGRTRVSLTHGNHIARAERRADGERSARPRYLRHWGQP